MSRRNVVAFTALLFLSIIIVCSKSDALTSLKTYKEVVITITVTPSPSPTPTPLVFVRPAPSPAAATQPLQFASNALWDIPFGSIGTLVAQTSVQPSPVPVQFVTKADPNAQYLKIIYSPTWTMPLKAQYGPNSYACVFSVYTYETVAYTLYDWGYGTVASGSGPFPIENAPTASYLSWSVPDLSSTVHVYSNAGSPGQTVWTGTAGQAQQHCVNLTLTVPSTLSAGTYQATIQYSLYIV